MFDEHYDVATVKDLVHRPVWSGARGAARRPDDAQVRYYCNSHPSARPKKRRGLDRQERHSSPAERHDEILAELKELAHGHPEWRL
jgi:hypothetical protein